MEHNLVAAVDVLQILYIINIHMVVVVIQIMFLIQEMIMVEMATILGLYTIGIVAIVETTGHQKHTVIQKDVGVLVVQIVIIVCLLVHSLQHLIIHIVELVECQMDKYFIHMAGNN